MDLISRTGRAPRGVTGAPARRDPGAGRGPLIGAAFGGVWFLIGLGALHGGPRRAAAVAGAVLAVAVTFAVLRARSRPVALQAAAPQPRGRAFVRLIVIQAVLLGVGAGLVNSRLDKPQLAFCWAALVVGGHFFPLARVLDAPLLRVLGAVMVAVVAATAAVALAAPGTTPWIWQALPGFGCACALWAAVLATGLRAPSRRQG
ncbi:hypothetical protein [Streptomyces sp. CB00455]|uniref:hypothetical protein n=1 Tax=Streptomyces sp. CB00455 TaxID=1703927 RepID=UPI00093D5195|nr:hypothetical protein [Streptomyces sp. CB00455]